MHLTSKNRLKKILVLVPTFMIIVSLSVLDYVVRTEKEFQQFVPEDSLKSEDLNNIVDIVKQMNAKPVLVTLVNDAYLPFLYSWLCNTKGMNIHSQVLVIATDDSVKKELKEYWPDLSVATISLSSAGGDQVFSHVGYVRLMIRRTQILLKLLESDAEIFLFESDSIWIKNPISYSSVLTGYDIIFGRISDTSEITGGLMHMFPTKATKAIFRELNKMLFRLEFEMHYLSHDEAISSAKNDQMYLSFLVNTQFAGLKSKIAPLSDFADGKWYCWTKTERRSSYPYLINNNYVVGNENKKSRAKMWGHFFIFKNNTCNFNQVDSIVTRWQQHAREPEKPSLYSPCGVGSRIKISFVGIFLSLYICFFQCW